jgi:hypothetical protein
VTERPGREERRRRREALRAVHPDLGGDPGEFDRVARALAAQPPTAREPQGTPAGPEVRFVRRPTGWHRVPSWWRSVRHRRSTPPRVR